jgi:hypothetical protein
MGWQYFPEKYSNRILTKQTGFKRSALSRLKCLRNSPPGRLGSENAGTAICNFAGVLLGFAFTGIWPRSAGAPRWTVATQLQLSFAPDRLAADVRRTSLALVDGSRVIGKDGGGHFRGRRRYVLRGIGLGARRAAELKCGRGGPTISREPRLPQWF